MYRFLKVGDVLAEVCDDCGYVGAAVDDAAIPVRLRTVAAAWAVIATSDERLLRARPAPATWCALEYGEHTAFALGAIRWAAGQFRHGASPDWEQYPEHLPDATDDNHACDGFTVAGTLGAVEREAAAFGDLAEGLTEAELRQVADYGDGFVIDTRTVLRHALHDAEHHVLDVRRGIARLLLTGDAVAS